jgi:hypothetical protein
MNLGQTLLVITLTWYGAVAGVRLLFSLLKGAIRDAE